jgi:hypothetical protein
MGGHPYATVLMESRPNKGYCADPIDTVCWRHKAGSYWTEHEVLGVAAGSSDASAMQVSVKEIATRIPG